jgi:hypothetical protein
MLICATMNFNSNLSCSKIDFNSRHSTDREVAIMMLMAYLSYMLAEVSTLYLSPYKCSIF